MPYQATAISPRMIAGMFAPNTPNEIRDATGYGVPVAWLGRATRLHRKYTIVIPTSNAISTCHAARPQREQAARGDIPTDAVHVGHPEREEVVRPPGLLLQRREVLVRQPRRVPRLDHTGAGEVVVFTGVDENVASGFGAASCRRRRGVGHDVDS